MYEKQLGYLFLNKIYTHICSYINELETEEINSTIKKHFKILGLLDDCEKWAAKELDEVKHLLIPLVFDKKDLLLFLEEVATIAKDNDYLMMFFVEAQKETFVHLMGKIEEDGPTVIPDMACLMIVLNRLAKLMCEDIKLVGVIQKIFKKNIQFSLSHGLFLPIKVFSVEKVITMFIKDLTALFQKCPSNYGLLLKINIMEAVIADYLSGNRDNARAGWTLLANRKMNLYSFDKEHKQILSEWASKNWVDLYTVWNLAFVSAADTFPYTFGPLLIPQVNNYKNNPELYMFKRVYPLYIYINYIFLRDGNAKFNRFSMKNNWCDLKFTKLWSIVNRECAEQ